MLFQNTSIETLVCLSCGESFSLNEVAIEKVGDLKIPAKIKAAGTMFKMFACPKCQNPHLGFIPAKITDNKVLVRQPEFFVGDPVSESAELFINEEVVETIVSEPRELKEIEEIEEPKKAEKINNSINEDDFANIRKPKKRRGPPVARKVKCTSCGEMKDVGAGFGGDFGTKCDACLKGALRDKKGN